MSDQTFKEYMTEGFSGKQFGKLLDNYNKVEMGWDEIGAGDSEPKNFVYDSIESALSGIKPTKFSFGDWQFLSTGDKKKDNQGLKEMTDALKKIIDYIMKNQDNTKEILDVVSDKWYVSLEPK